MGGKYKRNIFFQGDVMSLGVRFTIMILAAMALTGVGLVGGRVGVAPTKAIG